MNSATFLVLMSGLVSSGSGSRSVRGAFVVTLFLLGLRLLNFLVRQLRLKLDTREPKLIHTVRGFGYMMREP